MADLHGGGQARCTPSTASGKRPSLGALAKMERPLLNSANRPQVYLLGTQLSARGGLTVGRMIRCRAHQYVDVVILTTSTCILTNVYNIGENIISPLKIVYSIFYSKVIKYPEFNSIGPIRRET